MSARFVSDAEANDFIPDGSEYSNELQRHLATRAALLEAIEAFEHEPGGRIVLPENTAKNKMLALAAQIRKGEA